MAEVKVENPELHDEKTVDNRGRVYVGKEFAGKDVRIIVEVVDDEPEE